MVMFWDTKTYKATYSTLYIISWFSIKIEKVVTSEEKNKYIWAKLTVHELDIILKTEPLQLTSII